MDRVVWNSVIITSKMKLNSFHIYKASKIYNDELKSKSKHPVIHSQTLFLCVQHARVTCASFETNYMVHIIRVDDNRVSSSSVLMDFKSHIKKIDLFFQTDN